RGDPGRDRRLHDPALRPGVVATGQVLVHEHAVEPQARVQLTRQHVGNAALVIGRSECGQELAREPKRGDRQAAHHRAKATTYRKMQDFGAPEAATAGRFGALPDIGERRSHIPVNSLGNRRTSPEPGRKGRTRLSTTSAVITADGVEREYD